MCGFVAVAGKRMERAPLEHALEIITHRGPDEKSVWQSEDKTISLAHTRLSIIDLSGGKQPLTNADDSIVAVVNGEFYDYQDLRRDLSEGGYRFKTHSDSEILLALYERYGVRALKYLRGEFAFVLYDRKNHLVFAARDYFGIKPLFYTIHDNAIYFASEAKAFKALGIELAFEEESFIQALNFFPLPDGSLFKKVYQIPPAHYLIKSEFVGKERIQSYWDFNYPKIGETQLIDDEEAILGFGELLKESIKLRLKADVPVACYLSGGLDSCSILGIAQHLSSRPIESFTLAFEHADYDETAQAREMAAFVQSPFNPITISQDDIANSMEDAVWHAERFMINGHGVAKYLLSDAVHKAGFKVVLTGEGSDEIFGGYAYFRQDMILYNEKMSVEEKKALMADLKKKNKVSQGIVFANDLPFEEDAIVGLLGYLPSWIRGYGLHKPKILDVLSPTTYEKFSSRNFATFAFNFLDIAGQVEGRDLLSRSLYSTLR